MPASSPLPPELSAQPLDAEQLLALEAPDHPAAPPVEVPEAVQKFTITDDTGAEWCMRWLSRIDGEDRADKAQAAEWRSDVDTWLAARLAQRAGRRSFMENHLIAYVVRRRQAAEDAGERIPATLKLPSGEVKTTLSKPAVGVVDEHDKDVAAWLEEHGITGDGEDADPLVKWTAKVYLVPLRKILQPVELRLTDCETCSAPLQSIDGGHWHHVVEFDDDGQLMCDRPMPHPDPQVFVQRFACPPVDPSTGEPWADDVAIADRAVPGTLVSDPNLTVKVAPK